MPEHLHNITVITTATFFFFNIWERKTNENYTLTAALTALATPLDLRIIGLHTLDGSRLLPISSTAQGNLKNAPKSKITRITFWCFLHTYSGIRIQSTRYNIRCISQTLRTLELLFSQYTITLKL